MTKQQDGSVLYAVYGTLRKQEGNHHYMKNAEYLGTIKTDPKYEMIGKGRGFPIVTHGNTPIVCEIYKVTKESDINHINQLEGYTGKRGSHLNWYDTEDVETPWGNANIFVQSLNIDDYKNRIIETGDWKDR